MKTSLRGACALAFVSASLLIGCGGGGGSKATPPAPTPSPTPSATATASGNVSPTPVPPSATPKALAPTAITVTLVGPPLVPLQKGSYPLQVLIFANGVQLGAGTPLLYPVTLASNASAYVTFSVAGAGETSQASLSTVPNTSDEIFMNYTPMIGQGGQPSAPSSLIITATAVSVPPSQIGILKLI